MTSYLGPRSGSGKDKLPFDLHVTAYNTSLRSGHIVKLYFLMLQEMQRYPEGVAGICLLFDLVYWFCFLQPHPDVRPMAYANPLLSMLSWSCGTRIFYAQLSMLRKRSKYECISVKGHMTFYWPICISQYVYRLVCMFSLPYTSCWRWNLLFVFTKIKGCQIQPCIYSVRSDAFFYSPGAACSVL